MNLPKIVASSQKGDTKAFQILFELFYEDVYRTAYLVTRNSSTAEDAVQEAFLKAFERLDSLKEPKKFASWIRSIASNCAIDILRQQKRLIPVEEPEDLQNLEDFTHAVLPSPETEVERLELRDLLLGIINSLNPVYRQILVLKFFEDLTYQEIADNLELPMGTVKSRVHRALKMVSRQLISSSVHYSEVSPTQDSVSEKEGSF